jgi:phosphatidate phosphatase LPIN
MNYIRGAVNVISAPYQYYKDINPSTLTGAIDVIVIQRPTDSGDIELACSPFHVRFGKWQVLRPSEKKVNAFVNGNPIPFNMKIGEAGEAFFVFETDDDVPADLITSPILQPTILDDAQDSLSASNIPLLNPPIVQTQSAGPSSSYSPSPYLSPSPSPSPSSSPPSSSYLPIDRATSEPPPDIIPVGDANSLPSIPQRQEYSWEWGAFPQPSTIKPSSSKISATTTAKKFAKTLRLTSDQLVRICLCLLLSSSHLVCELFLSLESP